RGEHRRRPRREGIRAGAGRAGEVQATKRRRVPPDRAREPATGDVRAADRVRAAAAQAAVLLIGARMVSDGTLSAGGFVAFNLYLGMLVMPLRALGMWIGQAQRATAAGERI